MSTCFVIQPFDKGPFDKRYQDIIRPAIEAADLEPYRVDEDPAASIPIEEIERGIREARICVADITTDNPNVWFELGYAIACRKEVVLLCSEARETRYPFDIQHRNVIQYLTDSTQDFDTLGEEIARRIRAFLRKKEKLDQVTSPIADIEGLSQHEMAVLVAIAENLESQYDAVSTYTVRQDMERMGFTKVATFLALTTLVRKKLAVDQEEQSMNADDTYITYRLTQDGINWLMANQEKLLLKAEPPPEPEHPGSAEDDDIPF